MPIFIYIVFVFLFAYAILINYYLVSWNSIPIFNINPSDPQNNQTRISIIVPARNEEKNISGCLNALLQQSYPPELIEILVVNDHSTDETETIVRNFNNARIQLINLHEHMEGLISSSYKKKAIEIAISRSSGEFIITTDSDCIAPPNWIQCMVNLYSRKQAAFIAAPVKMIEDGSLLSVFQTLDFITLQGITGASVYKKIYSMCNGANLGYEKKAFFAVEGFKGIDSIASGDDMLLMHKIFKKFPSRVFFLKSADAIVSTRPVNSWKSFLQQRIRWASKADQYDDHRIFGTLMFVYIFNFLLLAVLLAGFWDVHWFIYFLILILVKAIAEFPFVYTAAGFFGQEKLMAYFFFLQPLHILYTVIVGFLGKFVRYEWKNRKLN
ncbi:MAG TPA: glycosyltransferase [Puia sp.]|nr:glycosyltransferase [Puia sp.]